MANGARKIVDFDTVHDFLTELFHMDVHARRVYSLANATLGVMTSASLAVHTHWTGARPGAGFGAQTGGEAG